jgi:nicotinamidase-related amidase
MSHFQKVRCCADPENGKIECFMAILIPNPHKKRALIVVDVQKGFTTEENAYALPAIKKVISDGGYDLFIEATFYAPKGSIWDRQMEWTFEDEPTLPEVAALLPKEKTISVKKTTRSVFPAHPEIADRFREEGIEEVHVIGFDANDCVLGTAHDSFDAGFVTYVIEEATAASNGDRLKQASLTILREVEMTNHSELIKEKKLI